MCITNVCIITRVYLFCQSSVSCVKTFTLGIESRSARLSCVNSKTYVSCVSFEKKSMNTDCLA